MRGPQAGRKLHSALVSKLKSSGLSMLDLAKLAGTTRQHIHHLASGKHRPTLAMARRVARALNCNVDDIFEVSE